MLLTRELAQVLLLRLELVKEGHREVARLLICRLATFLAREDVAEDFRVLDNLVPNARTWQELSRTVVALRGKALLIKLVLAQRLLLVLMQADSQL